jgi:hypothetical protein
MKKGLLLSLVASTVLFAGGDIAPVEPVADAPAAACDDFYGHAGTGIIFNRNAAGVNSYTYGVVGVLGVTKEIFSGVTLNVEVQGGAFTDDTGAHAEVGGLTQFNLGYTWCNTAFKVGRFAVPASLSPLAATGTDYFGLKKVTFEGVMVANTDLPDTTLWGAFLYSQVTHATTSTFLVPGNSNRATGINVIAGGFQNKSFADTTITVAGYYRLPSSTFAVAGSIDHKWCDTDISVGAAYDSAPAAYVVGGYIQQNFDASYIKVGATYGDIAYKKYTDFTNQATGTGANSWAIGAKAGTDWCGYKLWVAGDYQQAGTWEASVGVGKNFSGIDFAVDYRYNSAKAHRVRAKAVYKF